MTGPGDLHAVGFERSGFGCFFFPFFFFKVTEQMKRKKKQALMFGTERAALKSQSTVQ